MTVVQTRAFADVLCSARFLKRASVPCSGRPHQRSAI